MKSADKAQFVDLTARLLEPEVSAVWSLSSPDPSDLVHRGKVLATYPPTGMRRLFGFEKDGVVLCTCGVQDRGEGRFTVHQVATCVEFRRQGLGRKLLEAVIAEVRPTVVECGTDEPSVGFYRRCGFETRSEGVPPSGIERFHCRRVVEK